MQHKREMPFAVHVKLDCEHVEALNEADLDAIEDGDLDVSATCQFGGCEQEETWICLTCKVYFFQDAAKLPKISSKTSKIRHIFQSFALIF